MKTELSNLYLYTVHKHTHMYTYAIIIKEKMVGYQLQSDMHGRCPRKGSWGGGRLERGKEGRMMLFYFN